MSAILTKPIVVPEYLNGRINFYTAGAGGLPVQNAKYRINLQAVLNALFPGRTARPNCCKLLGADLFVAQSSGDSQAILKFPGYLANPATAIANAFNFTFDGSSGDASYLDMAFDAAGNLYVAEDQMIVRYTGTAAAAPINGSTNNNYTGKTVLGNAGAPSFFANLAFDPAGNLWVSDYANNRLVVFAAAGLTQANTTSYHILPNKVGPLAVANTDPGLGGTSADFLFTSPEGIDFDAAGHLWIANNNDFLNDPNIGNGTFTTLVRITPALQAAILATPAGGTLPPAQIAVNANCFIYNMPNGAGGGRPQFGGLQIDRAANRLYVNEQIDGKGRAYDLAAIAATPATVTPSILAITSTNPGNGGLALLQLGAYIADTAADQGAEPDTTTTTPWESPAISVRQLVYGSAGLPPHQDPIGGRTNQIYVEIRNFSAKKTVGIERLNLYWAYAGLGLGWPKPWDGTAGFLGGKIALGVAIPSIPPSGSVIVGPIPWATPDPATYAGGDHFCLLARIVTPPFHDPMVNDPMGLASDGMSFVEGPDIVANARANARIGWRNVMVLPAGTVPSMFKMGAALDNYTAAPMHAALRFALIDARGHVQQRLGGRVTVTPVAEAGVFGRITGGQHGDSVRDIVVPDGKDAIEDILIQPGQHVPILINFVPDPPIADYALRVTQTAIEGGSERIVGGQTFVRGHVAGFPVAAPEEPPAPPAATGWPIWLIWLLIAIGLIIVLLLLMG